MPKVGGKKFPYTSAGMQMAKETSAKTGQPVVKEYMGGGAVHYKSSGGSINNNEERYTVTQGHKNYKNKFKFA
jgi:hypothetical protein